MTIWKFPLKIVDSQVIVLPILNRILTVQMQDGVLCMWAIVHAEGINIEVEIQIFGTGQPIGGDVGAYVGTVQESGYVWHVFARTK